MTPGSHSLPTRARQGYTAAVPLVTGARVGPYEVLGPLGAGGMGEVYRARDGRLRRDVALKVLPLAWLGDADRRARFDREAQVLASLNHPSIAQVFGIELDGEAPVIVMELVEGLTLADRLAKGALALGEALPIAAQICDGLEAAHERGIVHRDLKPANIKLRPDGTIKILDFGLARVSDRDADADVGNSPTVLAHTGEGIVLGTAAYMSPEQARGRVVDKRTDIWAFGCVLYEMLTGAPVFDGESTTDVLANVVQREPDWQRLAAAAPERILDLLRRCLEKNPKDRLRDIADARFEIERSARSGFDAASSATAASAPAPARRSPWGPVVWFGAGAAIASGVLLLTPLVRGGGSVSAPQDRAVVVLPADTTLALSRGSVVALSPDGRTLVFAGKSGSSTLLYVRPLDQFDSRPLPGTEGAASPFFSPDGRWVGFFADGKLKKVSLDGGAPVGVVDVPNARGEVWGGNDTIFVTRTNNTGVSRVPAGGGQLEPVTTLHPGELSHRWPHLLPDGSAVLFSIWNDLGWEPSRIAVQPLGGGDQKLIVQAGGGYAHYIRDAGRHGYLVYARSEGLLAAPFDESRLAVTGQAVPIVDGVMTNLSGGAHFDLSTSGTLAYVPGKLEEADRSLVWVTLDGKAAPPLKFRGMTMYWRLSPDGTRVIRHNNNSVGGVWAEDLVRGTTTRLTATTDNASYSGVWSMDGKSVAYIKGVPVANIYRLPTDGRDIEERLTSSPNHQVATSFSPDGKTLAYTEFDPVSGSDIWVLTLPATWTSGSGPTGKPSGAGQPFVKTTASEGGAAFSPDGHWLVYQSNDSGRFEVFVRSFPDGRQLLRVSNTGGVSPIWSPKTSNILYRTPDGKVMEAAFSTAMPGRVGTPRLLFDGQQYESTFGASPDGQKLLMMPLISTEQSATQVRLVFNFLAELRQRVR